MPAAPVSLGTPLAAGNYTLEISAPKIATDTNPASNSGLGDAGVNGLDLTGFTPAGATYSDTFTLVVKSGRQQRGDAGQSDHAGRPNHQFHPHRRGAAGSELKQPHRGGGPQRRFRRRLDQLRPGRRSQSTPGVETLAAPVSTTTATTATLASTNGLTGGRTSLHWQRANADPEHWNQRPGYGSKRI